MSRLTDDAMNDLNEVTKHLEYSDKLIKELVTGEVISQVHGFVIEERLKEVIRIVDNRRKG